MIYIRKRLLLFLTISGLLGVLLFAIGAESGVIAAVSNRIAPEVEMKSYRYQDVPLKVSLPATTAVTEDYYSSGELLLNSYLQDDTLNYCGYIQIWRVADPEGFIRRSKMNSTHRFTSFEHRKISRQRYQGFLVSWTAQLQDGKPISGRDYVLQKKGESSQFLRISLVAEGTAFPEKLKEIGERMLSSLAWN